MASKISSKEFIFKAGESRNKGELQDYGDEVRYRNIKLLDLNTKKKQNRTSE